MNKDDLQFATGQLDRILAFFPRVDAKASWLFAINAGFLAIGCLNIHPADFRTWYVAVPGIGAAALIAASMYYLYRCNFPHLEGDTRSLIYFRSIADRTEQVYVEEFGAESEKRLCTDILRQIWRNSEILTMKFGAIRTAFILSAFALVPWCWFLIAVAIVHAQAPAIS